MEDTNEKLTEADFFKEVIQRFPEIKDSIDEWERDLPHLKMMEIAVYAKRLFDGDNQGKFKEVIEFVEAKIILANDELFNTIGVSFVEDLIWGYNKSANLKIVELLPEKMTYMYESLKPIHKSKSNH